MKTKFLIASLLFATTILGSIYLLGKYQERVKKQILIKVEMQETQKVSIAKVQPNFKELDQNQNQLDQLNKKIEVVTKLLQDAEHELKTTGFPEVLSDARLSEEERLRIIKKVDQASSLQRSLASLKIKKIDIEGEAL